MPSTRRVKKGPGRRPQSAKRQRFMELRPGVEHPGRGPRGRVSRTAGASWARGNKTYRNGRPVGFVPPLNRLAVREISARYLSQDERIEIADLHRTGVSIRQIADQLGRSPSTISRELRRNGPHRWKLSSRVGRASRVAGGHQPTGDQLTAETG